MPTFKSPILYRYVFREILIPFFVTLFVFTGILFLIRSLKLIDLVVNKDLQLLDMLLLFSYVIPRFLEIAIPISLLLGITLAFGRLSADSELVVIRSMGIRLKQLVSPVAAFSLLTFITTLVIGFWIRPWANFRLGVGMFEVAKLQATTGLVPGIFNELGPLTLYAANADGPGGYLNNVIIGDRRDSTVTRVFIAKHGQLVSDDERRTLTLQLYDGSIHEGSGFTCNVTYYDINKILLEEDDLIDDSLRAEKKASEMDIQELVKAMKITKEKLDFSKPEEKREYARLKVEFHRRLAIPTSCLCIALVAMALGVQPSRGGQSWGASVSMAMGIMVILIYYLGFAFATALAEQAVLPAWFVIWLPNFGFFLLAGFLFQRIESEQWLAVTQVMGDGLVRLGAKIQGYLR